MERNPQLVDDLLSLLIFLFSFQFGLKQLNTMFPNHPPLCFRHTPMIGTGTSISSQNRRRLLAGSRLRVIVAHKLFCLSGQPAIKYRFRHGMAMMSRHHFLNKAPAICAAILADHRKCVTFFAFHPSEPLFATCSADHTVKLWRMSPDGTTATCVATLERHNDIVTSVAFHPTARLIATSSIDGEIKLWRILPDGTVDYLANLLGHRAGFPSFVAFHPTALLLVTCSDNIVKFWRMWSPDGKRSTCIATLEDEERDRGHITSFAFHPNPNGLLFVTGRSNNIAKVWHMSPECIVDTGNPTLANPIRPIDCKPAICVAILDEHRGGHRGYSITSVAIHPTAPIILTGSDDKTAKLWHFSFDGAVFTVFCMATLKGHDDIITSVAIHPTEPMVATSSRDRTAKLWIISPDGTRVTCVATLDGHRTPVSFVAFNPNNPMIVTGGNDGPIQLWR